MSARWLVAVLAAAAACTNDHELGETSTSLGATRWAVTTGGPDIDYGKAVAIDNAGDVIAGGTVVSNDPSIAETATSPSSPPRTARCGGRTASTPPSR